MPELEREYAFLSYAREDLNQVRKVYEGLKKRKVNVWFDEEDMELGRWKPQIMKAISRSKYFVICLSNAAIKKTSGEKPGFQDEELQTAWEFSQEQDEKFFTIVPVRLEDCGRGDMRLSGWQQYDLFEDWEGILDKLAVNIGGGSLADITAKDERTADEKMLSGLMGRAEIFYYSGEYDKALSFIESAINIKPDDHEVWNNKGVALAALRRYEEALESFNKAMEIKPDYDKAWYNKGIALSALGRYEEAIKAYDKALSFIESAVNIKPDDHEVWNNKGIALGKLGRPDEALKAYDKAIELKPDLNEAWYNKGIALGKLGRYEEALEACNKAIELKPDLNEAWNNKGNALVGLDRKMEALEAYNKAIEIKPDDHKAWYNKAYALVALGRYEEALEAFDKAIEIRQDYDEA